CRVQRLALGLGGQSAVELGDDRCVGGGCRPDGWRHGCLASGSFVSLAIQGFWGDDMDLCQYIRDIPDFPKPGILFKDITPLLADPAAFQLAIEVMAEHYRPHGLDAIAAVEARGFLFAAPLALVLKKPLVPLRKPGKLPFRTYSLAYELEYGIAELQVHTDGGGPGHPVLLVDDLLATGRAPHPRPQPP